MWKLGKHVFRKRCEYDSQIWFLETCMPNIQQRLLGSSWNAIVSIPLSLAWLSLTTHASHCYFHAKVLAVQKLLASDFEQSRVFITNSSHNMVDALK